MSVLEQPLSHQRRPGRFLVFGIAVVVVLSGLTLRLSSMQLTGSKPTGNMPAAGAGDTRLTALEPIVSTRGLIYDRAGRPLVENVPTFTVRVRPADLPLSRRTDVVERLAGLLDTTPAAINSTLDTGSASRFDAIAIAREVPEATARLISEDGLTLPGVEVTVEPRRDYLSKTLLTQIVGYTGPLSAEGYTELQDKGYLPDDRIGKAGVELVYETDLRGTYGTQRVEKDATGRTVRVIGVETPPKAGNSLDPDHLHEGAEARREGAAVGPEEGRPQERRHGRDEPADGRGPGHGQLSDLRRQPVLARHHQRPVQAAC